MTRRLSPTGARGRRRADDRSPASSPSTLTTAIALALLLAGGCHRFEPYEEPAPGSPPTERETQILGGDVGDPRFLERWRRCTRYYSETTCYRDVYGGGGMGRD